MTVLLTDSTERDVNRALNVLRDAVPRADSLLSTGQSCENVSDQHLTYEVGSPLDLSDTKLALINERRRASR